MGAAQGNANGDQADDEARAAALNENKERTALSAAQFMKECHVKLEVMVNDGKKREEHELEVQKIRAEQAQGRNRKDAEAVARRRQLLAMESIRDALKPHGMTSKEYAAQCAAERKAEIDRHYIQRKLALSLKYMFVIHSRREAATRGREENFHRKRVVLFIMFKQLKDVFRKFTARFQVRQKEESIRRAKALIGYKITRRWGKILKWRGDHTTRFGCAIRHTITMTQLLLRPP